jgi:ABC-type bacteriocin/lantibiotic exporter with double-glycine peptidase domain
MTGNIERVEDVLNYDIESRPKCENQSETKEDIERLTGNIEIKNLTFAYGRLSPALIDDFNLTIEKGQMVALVGGSGSGKSTIAKIVTGLYKPRSGEILFDDKSIMDIDEKTFTSSLAMVDQNIELFHGSVRDNITMWDEDVPEEVLIQACKDACIHDDIMRLKGGYDAVIAEGGGNFSGGQRQKLEIARAFAVEPSILVLDEATSALDPTTEKLIMDAVRKRNMTCIIIAHRLSTIRDADKIIVLEYGKEVERGNHNELIEKDGQYAMLVRSE